ncbi:MAG: hypothetical protein JXC36_07630 [Candidatus Atribacteria bacterium]|nr:hypothetical protein [Candidatus Atribacteria bacterium]
MSNTIFHKVKNTIQKNNFLFIFFKNIEIYTIYLLNNISHYQLIKVQFFKKMGYPLNLKNPQSFNEKVTWKKIYDRNPLLPVVADKYAVRSYIQKMLGEAKAKEVLIPLLYVTDQPETIPFESLPPDFIIKPNHASGKHIIVEHGSYDQQEIIKICKRWLKTPYGFDKLEWAYQLIKRKIVIEELLHEDKGNPRDFKLYMFHGKCKLIRVTFRTKDGISKSAFDEKWHYLPIKSLDFTQGPGIEKPKNFKEMLELAEILSKPFDYIRVDLYNINGKIYFGELTNYPGSGLIRFEPKTVDNQLGNYWTIEPKYWKIISRKS